MTRLVIMFVLIFSIFSLAAQDITPWQYVRHSAVDNNNQVHVRFNAPQDLVGDYEFFDWVNSAWLELNLENPEPLVYEALLPYSAGQTLNYRLRNTYDVGGQSIVAVNPGFMSNDTFPPSLAAMGYIGDDPVGDSVSVYFSNLDLTGSWAGWSDNKIYTTLSNNANSFPVFNSLTSYNLYFAGIANTTTAVNDSSVYAMLYTFNIPGVISPGLYKLGINLADTTVVYQNIGTIQSQVVNGKLMLACNISDLTADPDFGSWPPAYNSLGFMAGSMRIDLDLGTLTPSFGIGDMTAIAQLIYEAYSYAPTTNTPPVISDVFIGINYVQFTYFDADQDFPLTANIIYYENGQTVDFIPSTPDFSQPVTMTAFMPVSGIAFGADITVSDNNINFVHYGIGDANEDETLPTALVCKAYPNPFNPIAGNLNITLTGLKGRPVSAGIYNLKGQCIKHLDTLAENGESTLHWDGSDSNSNSAANGMYFLKIRQENTTLNKKIMLVR